MLFLKSMRVMGLSHDIFLKILSLALRLNDIWGSILIKLFRKCSVNSEILAANLEKVR